MRRPCGFKPAQIDCQTENCQNEKIAPVAAVRYIGSGGMIQQDGGCRRQSCVESEPSPAEVTGCGCDQHVWNAKQRGERESQPFGKALHRAGKLLRKECSS